MWPLVLSRTHRCSSSSSSLVQSAVARLTQYGQYAQAHTEAAPEPHGTTVLCVRKDGDVVLMADGQLTLGDRVLKHTGRKIRRLAGGALGGFAGSTADGLTLFERLESRLAAHPGQLRRAAVELAKAWRQDRALRSLQATMVVADAGACLEVSGSGDVLEPSNGVHAIGSGARFAVAAARALADRPELTALEVAHRAMRIAADKCIYTNDVFQYEAIGRDGAASSGTGSRDGLVPAAQASPALASPPTSGGGGGGGDPSSGAPSDSDDNDGGSNTPPLR